MKIKPVKGTRDFYPDVMAVRNFIVDAWRRVSLRHGFEEYDGPILEHLDLYTVKSGDEIVEQLFNLTDRAGRALAIRPEITPTLARMSVKIMIRTSPPSRMPRATESAFFRPASILVEPADPRDSISFITFGAFAAVAARRIFETVP